LESAHSSKVLTCQLCSSIFINYGSYLCHVCFGPPTQSTPRAKFGCRVCGKQDLTTFLDFQFHIRKVHNVCDICMTVSLFFCPRWK
jgi:hypothetical protein